MKKKNHKVLSVSVAAYNVENYIQSCLESFVIPEILEELEVLIVDDGSTDSTAEIAKTYEKKYPGVFRLIQKENGGHGSTVNRGIQEATAAYFKTVDGDDSVDKEGMIALVEYLRQHQQADVVVTEYHWVKWDTGEYIKKITTDFPGKRMGYLYNFRDVCEKVYLNMHSVAMRTELLQTHAITLSEHCFYVDAQYVLFPIPYVETVVFLEKPVYQYRLGMDEQSMNLRNMQKNCQHHEKVLDSILELYQNMDNKEREKKAYLAKAAARLEASQIKIYLSYLPEKQWKNKIRMLEQQIKRQYPQVYAACENKAVKLLRYSGYRLYLPACKILRKQNHMAG